MKLLKDLGMVYPSITSKNKRHYGIFECPICKAEVRTAFCHVRGGKSTKCKPCATRKNKITHGGKGTRLYNIWKDMKKRCSTTNKKDKNYNNYKKRGIAVCEEWKNDFLSFKKWSQENGYNKRLTIDRKDNNGNYEPLNCRWVDKNIQARNTRKLMVTNTTGYRGVSFVKKTNKYRSQITIDKKVIYIGSFDTKEEAAQSYDNYIISNNLEHTTNIERDTK